MRNFAIERERGREREYINKYFWVGERVKRISFFSIT